MPFSLISFVFAALLLAAGVTDFLRQRIPNWIVLAIVALFLIQTARHLHEISWLNQLGAGSICLVVGMVLFSLGHVGAGDAKLLASVALWAGLSSLMPLLFLTSLAGLLLVAILLGARRVVAWRNWNAKGGLPKSLVSGEGIPFGVAIATGTLIAIQLFPSWLWRI